MPFARLDTAAVARALSQIADREGDVADVYFERVEEVEVAPAGEAPGTRVRREEGLAVRLARQGRVWLSSRDAIEPALFSAALRQAARVLPAASYPEPRLEVAPWEAVEGVEELADFAPAVSRAIRARHVAFPLRLAARRHRRWLQVVGSRLVPEAQAESFYSCAAEMPWGRWGALLPELGATRAEEVAARLVARFRARQAAPPEPFRGTVVLAPEAAAVLLHEAVAHALEADVLALGGRPAAALGLRLGVEGLHILDDPTSAPPGVRRTADDEGVPTGRRWLLRDGAVEQPLADSFWAGAAPELLPGAARRGSRHLPPAPRSTHLELLPGGSSREELLAVSSGGLYITEVTRGTLDALGGGFQLELPFARRLRGGEVAEAVGPCRLRGRVAELLGSLAGIGDEARPAGAGWCAKGGQKLPVWATTPALRLEGVEVVP